MYDSTVYGGIQFLPPLLAGDICSGGSYSMKILKSLPLAGLLLLLSLALVPAAFAQSATAKVRVVHASPDAPAVDVWVDGSKVLSGVTFFTASDYLDLPAG